MKDKNAEYDIEWGPQNTPSLSLDSPWVIEEDIASGIPWMDIFYGKAKKTIEFSVKKTDENISDLKKLKEGDFTLFEHKGDTYTVNLINFKTSEDDQRVKVKIQIER